MPSNAAYRGAITVLGAHRSGTSTVTRALNLLGVYLGEPEHLMPPLPENPKGFWEHLEIYDLQERILAVCGRTWDTVLPLPAGWRAEGAMAPLIEELERLVRQRFAAHSLWLWKDPRSCLLLSLWREVLARLSIALRVLFVVRNPLDVARSLQRRNGFPLDKGFGIWLHCNLAALHDLTGLEVVWLSYDRFLADWEGELRRCAKGLEIPWPQQEAALRQEMENFVQPGLRHSQSSMADLRGAGPPEPVVRLYQVLEACLTAGRLTAVEQEAVDRLYAEYVGWGRLVAADVRPPMAPASKGAAVESGETIDASPAGTCAVGEDHAQPDREKPGARPGTIHLLLRRWLWTRRTAEGQLPESVRSEEAYAAGAFPPGHYYSPIPAKEDVLAYVRARQEPAARIPGIRLNRAGQYALLKEYIQYYKDLYFPEKQEPEYRYYYDNEWFGYGDAIFLYCFLRKYRPQRIVEIGSGFSSAVILDTVQRFYGKHPEMTMIEPEPDRLMSLLTPGDRKRVTVIPKRVQDVSCEVFGSLGGGDLLFIDSSHVVKCGSDLHMIFDRVLPMLTSGVFVHFHDVLYPFDYPDSWLINGRYWNENYFLRAFLSWNDSWDIVFFVDYIQRFFADVVAEHFPLARKVTGASLYLQRRSQSLAGADRT